MKDTQATQAIDTARRLLALSPDEILARIVLWRIRNPEMKQALAVLVDAYKEVCRIRLEQVLED